MAENVKVPDITDRLREAAHSVADIGPRSAGVMHVAEDEIRRLRARVTELQAENERLRDYLKAIDAIASGRDRYRTSRLGMVRRRVNEALAAKEGETKEPPKDWAATPEGKEAIQKAFEATKRFSERLDEVSRIDRRKLDEPMDI